MCLSDKWKIHEMTLQKCMHYSDKPFINNIFSFLKINLSKDKLVIKKIKKMQ